MEVALDLFYVVEREHGNNGKMLEEYKYWINRKQLHKHNAVSKHYFMPCMLLEIW